MLGRCGAKRRRPILGSGRVLAIAWIWLADGLSRAGRSCSRRTGCQLTLAGLTLAGLTLARLTWALGCRQGRPAI